MALNVNDILSRGWTRFRATAGGNAALPAGTRIMAVALTATASATLRIDNAATAGAAADSIDIAALIGTTAFMQFPTGTLFNVGVSTALGGTGALTIYYIAE